MTLKLVILAGGVGSRLSEETDVKPKPMVEIGGRPILWHIMKLYAHHGVREFVICAGYKGYVIKEYFANYFLHDSDVTFDLGKGGFEVHKQGAEPWKVTVVDTGVDTQTGGRLLRVQPYVGKNTFCLTYGDGLADVHIKKLLGFHRSHGLVGTVTAVTPPGRFGALEIHGNKVNHFVEKPLGDGAWINGGFFVMSPKIFDYLSDSTTVFEREPLSNLAKDGQLGAYQHEGFWQAMDTLRDKRVLDDLWNHGEAPWKVW